MPFTPNWISGKPFGFFGEPQSSRPVRKEPETKRNPLSFPISPLSSSLNALSSPRSFLTLQTMPSPKRIPAMVEADGQSLLSSFNEVLSLSLSPPPHLIRSSLFEMVLVSHFYPFQFSKLPLFNVLGICSDCQFTACSIYSIVIQRIIEMSNFTFFDPNVTFSNKHYFDINQKKLVRYHLIWVGRWQGL